MMLHVLNYHIVQNTVQINVKCQEEIKKIFTQSIDLIMQN